MSDDLPIIEFAFPGPLRDQLLETITKGIKTATSSLVHEYNIDGAPLPTVGAQGVAVDSQGDAFLVLETTAVAVVRLGEVTLQHALDEGEGYASVAEWRAGHERFWTSAEMLEELGADFALTDDTMVVLERFRAIQRPSPSSTAGLWEHPEAA